MIYCKLISFLLITSYTLTFASVPIITLHDGHITLNDYLLKKDYHGTIIPGQPYTIDIYLSQSQHYDYVIESCVYNNKTTFITNNGCINADKIFVDKWETTEYGYPNSLKRTLIHFIAPEATLHVHCLLRLIECCSCAEKSCENPTGYSFYPYTPYQLIMSLPTKVFPQTIIPSVLPELNGPAFTSLIPQRFPTEKREGNLWNQWWFWLLLVLAFLLFFCLPCLIAIIFLLRKKQKKKSMSKILVKDNNGYITTESENNVHDQNTQTFKDTTLESKKNIKSFSSTGHQHVHRPTNLDIYKLERDSLFSHSSDSFINDEFETTMSQTKSAKIISNPHSTLPFHRVPVDVPENIVHEIKDNMTTIDSTRFQKPFYRESQNFSEQTLKKGTFISSPLSQQHHQDMLRRSNGTIDFSRKHESVFI